jgi:hypothetical protein
VGFSKFWLASNMLCIIELLPLELLPNRTVIGEIGTSICFRDLNPVTAIEFNQIVSLSVSVVEVFAFTFLGGLVVILSLPE